jgi:hypothetical protein
MWKSANSESVTGPDGTEYGAQVNRDERGVTEGSDVVVRLAAGTVRHGSTTSPNANTSTRIAWSLGDSMERIVERIVVVMVCVIGPRGGVRQRARL